MVMPKTFRIGFSSWIAWPLHAAGACLAGCWSGNTIEFALKLLHEETKQGIEVFLIFVLNSVFADIGRNQGHLVVLAVLGVVAPIAIVFFVVFLRLFGLWLQASMARANVSFLTLICMILRRTPMKELVRLKIMAVQAGLSISTRQMETALLQGADV